MQYLTRILRTLSQTGANARVYGLYPERLHVSPKKLFIQHKVRIMRACAKKFTKYLIMKIKKYIILKSAYFI